MKTYAEVVREMAAALLTDPIVNAKDARAALLEYADSMAELEQVDALAKENDRLRKAFDWIVVGSKALLRDRERLTEELTKVRAAWHESDIAHEDERHALAQEMADAKLRNQRLAQELELQKQFTAQAERLWLEKKEEQVQQWSVYGEGCISAGSLIVPIFNQHGKHDRELAAKICNLHNGTK